MTSSLKTLTPKQAERREKVLRSVRRHLKEHGIDGLSMRKVAQQARVSPSTLYEIYGSKEALILYAVRDNLLDLSKEEDQYQPGLERFCHRLDSIAKFFTESSDTARAVTKLFLQGDPDSPANEIFLDNAIAARKASLLEMKEMREIKNDIDVDFFSRALISLTWGTALFWIKDKLPTEDFRSELIRSSMSLLLPLTTNKSKKRIQTIIEDCVN